MLVATLVFSLAACGGSDDKKEETKKEDVKKDEKKEEEKKDKKDEVKKDEKKEEKKDEEEKEAKDSKNFRVALVTDTGGIDDKSFNQGTWEGIQRFVEETGAEANYSQSNSDADYVPNLSTFSEDEYDLIVAPGFLFEKAMTKVSSNFPDRKYLIIDTKIVERPNVASATFAENEGSFLVGVAAAKVAKDAGKKKVAFIGGGDFYLIQKFEAGYEQGVAAVDPEMEVAVEYVGDFVNSGKGQSLASKLYDEGAYVIYHAAGGAGNGLLKEAKDRRINGQEVWAIGVDKDQYQDGIYEDGKSAVLTSMMKGVDIAAHDVSKMAMEGKFPGGEILVFNLANDGVGIPKENPNLSAEVVTLIQEYKEKIKTNEIKVKEVPNRIENKQ